ncbi:MAG: hypothetical protein WCI73_00375 [Phycisphaerae bacterium]
MDPSPRQFGLIVAYLLPGFVGLVGLVPLLPAIGQWLQPERQGDLGFGPPVYALLAATAVGKIISCFRWVLVDQLHHHMGVKPPQWNDRRLDEVLGGFDYLVQNHFRYYEFAANMLIASLWAYLLNRIMQTSPILGTGTDLGMLVLTLVLFAASRDALAKYYSRTNRLLGQAAEKGSLGDIMYNGNHHAQEAGASSAPSPEVRTEAKAESKAQAPTKPQQATAKDRKSGK